MVVQNASNSTVLEAKEVDALKVALQKLNLEKGEKVDVGQLGQLCKQVEGRLIPFDRIQAAINVVHPERKGELSEEEFIKVIAHLRGKTYNSSSREAVKSGSSKLSPKPAEEEQRGLKIKEVFSVKSTLGKRNIQRFSGATESSSHTIDQEELEQFSLHLNDVQKRDRDLKHRPVVLSENFFESCRDGLLLSKLVNDSAPDTIDERVLNVGDSLNPFKMTENINLAINSAKAIGCSVVNIGPVDILEGRQHLILGLVWQVIKVGLLAKISLLFHPELKRLLLEGETLEEFLKLPADQILLRWFNFQLARTGTGRRVANFTDDLIDSECYLHLLNVLVPEKCPKTQALRESDLEKKAAVVVANAEKIGCDKYVSIGSIMKANHKLNLAFVANLFNHFPGLEELSAAEKAELDEKLFDSRGDCESRTFALWMNSLGVNPFVNSIEDDLRDGRVLLQVIDAIQPGKVNWRHVCMQIPNGGSQLTRFQALENTNNVVELCHSFKFSLVGIQGADLTDGVKKLTLALVWQLMRQHIVETLRTLSTADMKEITDEFIIKWANAQLSLQCPEKSSISSFKDPNLKNGVLLLKLIEAIKPGIVDFELVNMELQGESSFLSNAKYAISIARKLGASIFLLPEDIVLVQPKMIMTFIGSLMAIDLQLNKLRNISNDCHGKTDAGEGDVSHGSETD